MSQVIITTVTQEESLKEHKQWLLQKYQSLLGLSKEEAEKQIKEKYEKLNN